MASGNNKSKKNTSRKKEPTPQKKEPVPQVKEKKHLSFAAALAIGLLLAFILELSNFNVFGPFGAWVQYAQFGLFGIMAYIFPLFVLLLLIASTYEVHKVRTIFCAVIMFIMMCVLSHLVSSFSLNNRNVLSYFEECARTHNGGGIIGGSIALGLFLLLSQSGALIISILIILICLFFVFEDQIRKLFSSLSSHDKPDSEDYEYEDNDEKYEKPARARKHVSTQDYYEEPVIISQDEDGTVIRLVKRRNKRGRTDHAITMTRTNKKAEPLRGNGTNTVRSSNKARGVSNELDLVDHNANGDEIHEITRKTAGRKKAVSGRSTRDLFSDTLIIPAEEEQIEWDLKKRKAQASQQSTSEGSRNHKTRTVSTQQSNTDPSVSTRTSERSEQQGTNSRKKSSGGDTAYKAPPLELLNKVKGRAQSSEAELEKIADNLEIILAQYGVNATVTDIQAGPAVTRFELQPEMGTRVNKITGLENDLKLNLGVTEIRIEAPIPGRQAVGIEIPNKNRQTVYMRELLEEPDLIKHPSRIAFAAGKDISGNVVVSDIAKMPHLLVAGTTGSGKSVFLNTILMTILYRAKPSEVGLIIIDPKKVEFGIYAGIPHLMKEVVTDPGQAVSTLRWAVSEMTNRYQRMQLSSVREFRAYNAKVEKGTVNPEEENPRMMNQIVIIIDELADLMMVAKKEAEALICRLAQLARAAGIHLIIATQRPSVDVVTGLIKANVPARVALLVSSQIDSRTIIDMPGAEKLLGYGDMLFYPTGYVKPLRVQGAFVSDDEIQRTVDYLIENNKHDYFAAEAQEIDKFMNSQGGESAATDSGEQQEGAGKYDEYFYEAGKLCIEMGKASSSMLQRRFNLGFNRAARIIDQLEDFGAVGPQNGAKPREILVDLITFEEMYEAMINGDQE